ncbi:N-acetylglucosamine-6-phosphate deacetylase [Limobrevibacterium gyesilva]|uniref:N-acetylglucosamine-6-phosphate deacetylase n=1 Tax=Limobrevibacterium gyesilva TaxID=2991712 RepID=A0AA41YP51_9PROT|nr:N-acetylglucosamine-6-phosphate deacetylase [Limobrevibacterium gyesilva]MCW3476126.1 N-acetylglucosamine-6-phosphate deacetylase [Limobrevibacterium gyesilva]
MIALLAARLFDGEAFAHDQAVLLDGPTIAGVAPAVAIPLGTPVIRLPDHTTLAPGFIDLQVNGGGGVMFNDAATPDCLSRIAAAHGRAGTTTILPTLISGTRPQLRLAVDAARAALAAGMPGIAGLHLEGPFIAPTRRGIHPAANVTVPDDADIALLCAPFPGHLKVTLAPETVAPAQITRLCGAGVTVFAGHTDATYEQVRAGLDAGVTGFTHLFNAMSQFASRNPGAVGAALDSAQSHAGIIVDGHHVHPASVRIAFAAKGAGRLFLVSDAMATAASDCRGFVLNGEPIHLADGRLTNAAGTLAGAHLTMADAVRNAVRLVGIPLESALRMATATPAGIIRRPDLGRISAGCTADLVALDAALHVIGVWQKGTKL